MFDIIPKPSKSLNAIASYKIMISGFPISSTYSVKSIEVHKEINKISRSTVSLLAGDVNLQTFDETDDSNFKPGNSITIQLGYDSTNSTVFEGIINKQRISLGNGYKSDRSKSVLILECVDSAIKLTNSYTSDIFEKKSDSEMISSLISKVGLSKSIDMTFLKYPFFPKYNSNDWQFILERAKINGMVVINSDNEIKVTDPYQMIPIPSLQVDHGDATLSFDGQIDSSFQYGSLEYSSWDPFNEKAINSTSSEPSLNTPGGITTSSLKNIASPSKTNIMLPQPFTANELKALAGSKFLESRLTSHFGSIGIKGVNSLVLGSLIKLNGFGGSFDGLIYVSGISHILSEGSYKSKIQFGIRRDFLKNNIVINKNEISDQINGVHIGIVKQIDKDPDNEYKVKVNIPALKVAGTGIWCRLTHFYTSSKAGSFFIPEIGTEVVVSFISNDSRFPVILGGLYTKKNKPYSEIKKENNLKAIVTKEKLTLEFDDKDKIINISTSEKNKITISEKKNSIGIKVTDGNGNIIETSKNGVSISAKKDIKINSDGKITLDGKKGIDIKSLKNISLSGSNVSASAKAKFSAKGNSGADLTASGKVTIKGSATSIN